MFVYKVYVNLNRKNNLKINSNLLNVYYKLKYFKNYNMSKKW